MDTLNDTQADETTRPSEAEASETSETVAITPNQVVAQNLFRARTMRRWTQEQAAEALEPYLGTRWSKATFSAAERSYTGERVRNFTADDLYAFALAFEVPVAFFLLPPDPTSEATGRTLRVDVGQARLRLLDAVIAVLDDAPTDDESGPIGQRVAKVLVETPDDERNAAVQAVRETTTSHIRYIVAEKVSQLRATGDDLREVADLIDAAGMLAYEHAQRELSDHGEGDR